MFFPVTTPEQQGMSANGEIDNTRGLKIQPLVPENRCAEHGGATVPKRNTFSNANRTRDPAIAENLYWAVFRHLQQV